LIVTVAVLVGSVTEVAVTIADPAAPEVGATYVTDVIVELANVPLPV